MRGKNTTSPSVFYFSKMIPERLKDYKIKPLARFYRPDFSPFRNSFEYDYVFGGRGPTGSQRWYLGIININTKYLFMFPCPEGRHCRLETTKQATEDIIPTLRAIHPDAGVFHIRGDGDSAFGTTVDAADPGELNDP
jgi:hypothetical protein